MEDKRQQSIQAILTLVLSHDAGEVGNDTKEEEEEEDFQSQRQEVTSNEPGIRDDTRRLLELLFDVDDGCDWNLEKEGETATETRNGVETGRRSRDRLVLLQRLNHTDLVTEQYEERR